MFTSLFSFGLSIWLIAFISIELYNQRYNLQQIWIFRLLYSETFESKIDKNLRNENFDQGFWSLIVCLVGALSETVFGLASFVTCLHYSDVVERLQLYSEVKQLAEEYPGQGFTHQSRSALRTIGPMYLSLRVLWSIFIILVII